MSGDQIVNASVIICTYTEERWDDLMEAVASMQRQVALPREIIVVVDHNPRLTERALAQLSGIIVTASNEPRGLSGARNHGTAIAKGELIAFLDDDAIAESDWLLRLSQHCADQRVMGVGGFVEPSWMSKRPLWFPEEFYWVVGCSYLGLPQTVSEVRNPYGGCTCFRREVFETVGGFRDGIGRVGTQPMGGEETELCIRARRQWPHKFFLYDPQARIHHRVPSRRNTWQYFRLRCFAEGLSKALISHYVGAKSGLSSERAYMGCTLPQGVLRNMGDLCLRHDPTGLLRAGAIICGLFITALGYLAGMISQSKRASTHAFVPKHLVSNLDPSSLTQAGMVYETGFPASDRGKYKQ